MLLLQFIFHILEGLVIQIQLYSLSYQPGFINLRSATTIILFLLKTKNVLGKIHDSTKMSLLFPKSSFFLYTVETW